MPQQKWYYVNASLDKVGPITLQALESLADNGVINPQTTLLTEDGSKMLHAGSIPGLFPDAPLAGTTSSILAPPRSPTASGVRAPESGASSWNGNTFQTPDLQSIGTTLVKKTEPINYMIWVSIGSLFGVALFALSLLAQFGPKIVSSIHEASKPVQTPPLSTGPIVTTMRPPRVLATPLAMSVFDEETPPLPGSHRSVGGSLVSLPLSALPDLSGNVKNVDEVETSDSVVLDEPSGERRRQDSRSTETIVSEVEGSVALVRGRNSSGTGFVVRPGIIATNSHVIDAEEIDDLNVHFPSENGSKKGPFTAQLLYEDPKRDLAFLEIPSKEHTPLPTIRDYKFRRGQKIIVIGNPGRGDGAVLENAVTEGVLSTQTEMDGQWYYQLSIAINVGNSGGPVFNDEGDVIGVVTLKSAKAEAMAYCIPPDELNLALEAIRRQDPADLQYIREQHASRVFLNRGLERLQVLSEVPMSKVPDFAREAIQDLDEAIRHLPDSDLAYFARGLFKAVLNDVSGALTDLDKAVELAPEKTAIRELRDLARNELNRRGQGPAGGQLISRYQALAVETEEQRESPAPRSPRFGAADTSNLSPLERAMNQDRYQQVVNKKVWTFNGTPIRGRIVGFKDGIVQLKLTDAAESEKPIERYANRFSYEDIEDIRFYAMYHGIPAGNLQKR